MENECAGAERGEKKAVAAMSGGVDSAVAALLAKEQGLDLIGVTLRLFDNDDAGISRERSCCGIEDVEDARAVAARLGIPYYVFNFKGRFRELVMERFVRSYMSGATPNPCVDCNRYIKFDELLHRARELGCGHVITGHYARTERDGVTGRYLLKRALDRSKDQSYVLWSLTQDQLASVLFPLGGLLKSRVREIAEENGFKNAAKPDSQDICFVPEGDYAGFIESYTGRKFPRGSFTDSRGNVLGEHGGIIRYTVGQRRGLGVCAREPLYVKDIIPGENRVVLSPDAALYSREFFAGEINLISVPEINGTVRACAKVRYRHEPRPGLLTREGAGLRFVFDEPQRAITRGQSAVFYDGDTVIGGGVIGEVP